MAQHTVGNTRGDETRFAAMIADYWRDRGHTTVETRVESASTKFGIVYAVRSNLKNGLPPKAPRVVNV